MSASRTFPTRPENAEESGRIDTPAHGGVETAPGLHVLWLETQRVLAEIEHEQRTYRRFREERGWPIPD